MNLFRKLMALTALLCMTTPALAQKTKMPAGADTKMSGKMVGKSKMGRKMPPRDPKTGRFMKSGKSKMTGKMAGKTKIGKMLPPRDPKTGRFMKSDKSKTKGKM